MSPRKDVLKLYTTRKKRLLCLIATCEEGKMTKLVASYCPTMPLKLQGTMVLFSSHQNLKSFQDCHHIESYGICIKH